MAPGRLVEEPHDFFGGVRPSQSSHGLDHRAISGGIVDDRRQHAAEPPGDLLVRDHDGGAGRHVGVDVQALVAAGVAWTWLYSPDGLVNQILRVLGLSGTTRAWLGDFTFALPAVGVIGVWVMLGFCTVLLLSGIGKIDPALYEAASLDGAGRLRQFRAVTLPGLRQEVVVCTTFTVVAALASFDVIQVSTQGGPGYQTIVPGVEIYRLTFLDQRIGQASALAIFLTVLVLLVIWPIQRLGRTE